MRFMDDANVSFTNNQSENEIRMAKVQLKTSACFRSEKELLSSKANSNGDRAWEAC